MRPKLTATKTKKTRQTLKKKTKVMVPIPRCGQPNELFVESFQNANANANAHHRTKQMWAALCRSAHWWGSALGIESGAPGSGSGARSRVDVLKVE